MVSSTTIVALDLFEDTGGLGNLQSKRRCLALNTISVPANVPAFSPTSADPFVSAALTFCSTGNFNGLGNVHVNCFTPVPKLTAVAGNVCSPVPLESPSTEFKLLAPSYVSDADADVS